MRQFFLILVLHQENNVYAGHETIALKTQAEVDAKVKEVEEWGIAQGKTFKTKVLEIEVPE